MSLYERKSFTVPASAGSAEYCAEHGHTEPDQRGKCLRCGMHVRFDFQRISKRLHEQHMAALGLRMPRKP